MASFLYQNTNPGRPPQPGTAYGQTHPQQIHHPSPAFASSGHQPYVPGQSTPSLPYPSMLPPRGLSYSSSHRSGLARPFGSGPPPAGPISAGLSYTNQNVSQYTSSHTHQTLPPPHPPSSHASKPPHPQVPPRAQSSQPAPFTGFQSSLLARAAQGSSSQGNVSSYLGALTHSSYSSSLANLSQYSSQVIQASAHLTSNLSQGIGRAPHGSWGAGNSDAVVSASGRPSSSKGDYTDYKGNSLQPADAAKQSRGAPPAALPGSKVETEEQRRERKKREYEKKRLEDKQREKVALGGGHSHLASTPGSHRDVRTDKKTIVPAEKIENRLKRHSTFLCKIKFRNELPDPASEPKLLRINTDKELYTKYKLTSLEKNYKHKLPVESDLGIPLDLLDLSVYNVPQIKQQLDPADAELLVDDEVVVKEKMDSIRKKDRPTDKGMAWLVKTTYISPINLDPAKQSLTEKQAKELREQREGRREILELLNDREQQINAIEESFRVSKLRPVHQTKPELEPVEVWPLLPDFDRVGDQFVHVVFDTEPTAETEVYSKLGPEVREELEERALLKSFSIPGPDSRTEKFVAYMVPKVEELVSDIYDNNDEISYTWVREYHWDLRAEDERNTYVLSFGDDCVQYMPLSTKMILQKKKAKDGRPKDDVEVQFPIPSNITVRRMVLTDEEEENRIMSWRTYIEDHENVEVEESNALKRKRSIDAEEFSPKRIRTPKEMNREVSDNDLSD